MARRPKPTAVKIKEGARKDRINFNEPSPTEATFGPPAYYDKTATKAWGKLRLRLQEMKVLSEQDETLLEIYGQVYSDYIRTLEAAITFGPFRLDGTTDDKLEVTRCPVTSDIHRYRDQMIKILVECGLTPSARQSLIVSGVQEDLQMRSDGLDLELEGWTPKKKKESEG